MSITLTRSASKDLAILTGIKRAVVNSKLSHANVASDAIAIALTVAETAHPKVAKQVRAQVAREMKEET